MGTKEKIKGLHVIPVSLLLLACVHNSLNAQQFIVRGTLKDSANNNSIGYANCVLLRNTDSTFAYGVTTGENGEFVFKNVDAGNYLLRISMIGYASYWREVQVQRIVNLGTIRLKQSSTSLKTLTVTGERPIYSVDGEKAIYNPTEDPSVQTGTMSDVLQNAPGVEVDAEGNITLRGTSEVEIWINDRPSHMNEEALKQYIKQLPANSIERVEVITNPSARYSSKGAVINIVTNHKIKRNELLCVGVNGTTLPSISPWVSYVWANEKMDFNFYLNGNYSRHDGTSDGTTTLLDGNGDTSRFTKYRTDNQMPYWGGYAGLNFNWNIDSMTHLSAWMGAYPNWNRNSICRDYEYIEYQPSRVDLGYLDTLLSHGFSSGGYAGAWLEHRFDSSGGKLSASFNGNYWSYKGLDNETFAYRNPLRDTLMRRSNSERLNPYGRLSLNYLHPIRKSIVLEAGTEMEYGGGSLHLILDTMSGGSYVNVPLRSHDGVERGSGLNGYLTVQKRWGGLTAKLGLRGEYQWKYSQWNYFGGNGTTTVDTSFFGLVPSLHLSYQTKTFTSYSISYTRRFSTPGSTKLNTFRRFDDYGFETGNPNLLISYTHNLEAAFSKYIMKFGNIGLSAYYRANTDEIGTMTYAGYAPEYFGSLLVNYTCPENIGSSHTEGIEANVTYRPKAFFNVRFNASLFNYGYNYNDFSDSKVSYSFRLNLWAKLWNRLEIFANGSYRSPRLGLYSLTNPNKRIDFGCSSDFFQRKMSVYLNVSDIFGWSEWGSNTTAPQYQTTGSQRYKSTFVSLGITFRFGKMELESKAKQGGASNESGGMRQ
ncbi:MAG: outer membrane beta-barrel protein [Bacteroidales bacterium]|nr:outer membrane beta-barrel protein [Bacteroidales bacterium]